MHEMKPTWMETSQNNQYFLDITVYHSYMWYLPDHAGGSRIWSPYPALPSGRQNLPQLQYSYPNFFTSDHFASIYGKQ